MDCCGLVGSQRHIQPWRWETSQEPFKRNLNRDGPAVIYSNAEEVTVAAVAGIPASGAYLLYYTGRGCSSFTRRQ